MRVQYSGPLQKGTYDSPHIQTRVRLFQQSDSESIRELYMEAMLYGRQCFHLKYVFLAFPNFYSQPTLQQISHSSISFADRSRSSYMAYLHWGSSFHVALLLESRELSFLLQQLVCSLHGDGISGRGSRYSSSQR